MISKNESIENFFDDKQQFAEISTVLLSEFNNALCADNFYQLLGRRSDYEKTINHLRKEISSFKELITASSDNVTKSSVLQKLKKLNNHLKNLLFNYEETAEWYFITLAKPALELVETIMEEIKNHQSELHSSDKEMELDQFWMDFETTLFQTSLNDDSDDNGPFRPFLAANEHAHESQQSFLLQEKRYPSLRTSLMAEINEETAARKRMPLEDGADKKVLEKKPTVPGQEAIQYLPTIDILPIEIVDYIYRIGLGSCTSLSEGRKFISAFMLFGGYYQAVAADKLNAGTGIQLFESLIYGSWNKTPLEAAFEGDNATLLEVIMVNDGNVINRAYLTGVQDSSTSSVELNKLYNYLEKACKNGSIRCMKYLFSLDLGQVSWKKLIDKNLANTIPLLTLAAHNGHIEIVNLLLSKGAHSNIPSISSGKKDLVRKMVISPTPESFTNHLGRFNSPLLAALINHHCEIAKALYPPKNRKIKINTQAVMRELLITLLEEYYGEEKSVLEYASKLLEQPVDINFNFNGSPFITLIINELQKHPSEEQDLEVLIDLIEYLFEWVDAEVNKREDKSLLKFLGSEFIAKYLDRGIQLNHIRILNIVLKRMSRTELATIKANHQSDFSQSVHSPIAIRIMTPLFNLEAAHYLYLAGVSFTFSYYKNLTLEAIKKKNVNILSSLILNECCLIPQMSTCWPDIIQIFLATGNLNELNPMIIMRLMEIGADLSKHLDMTQYLVQALEHGDLKIARHIIIHGNYDLKSRSAWEAVLNLIADRDYCDIILLLLQNKQKNTLVISSSSLINRFVISAIKHNNKDLYAQCLI